MNIEPRNLPDLEPLEDDSIAQTIELGFRNYALFSIVDEQVSIIFAQEYKAIALNFISKLDVSYPLIFVNELTFGNLFKKYQEFWADKNLSSVDGTDDMDGLGEDVDIGEFLKNSADILDSSDSAPVIKFVNSLFFGAIKAGASDIHIEAHEFRGEVRFRVNGVLNHYISLDTRLISLVISRIKVISHLDISEKRIPQDGRTNIKLGGTILDIRVSVLPTYYGERVVMRILMKSSDIPKLDNIGLQPQIIEKLHKLLLHPHGIILVTGPTGSGKSTTLHSLLHEIYTPQKNIITIEDPVEYKSDKINQIQVNEKVGLTFASGLRSILRQDPDIIMVGEIRDQETAKIAIQAALTGHLVFSTLHTNTSTAAITRLVDMGLERYLLKGAILGVLSQRLVRVLCDCKITKTIDNTNASLLGLDTNLSVSYASGCEKCNNTGYSKRQPIGELFVIEGKVAESIGEDIDDTLLRKIAIENSLVTLQDGLKAMLLSHQTSVEEVVRVGYSEH